MVPPVAQLRPRNSGRDFAGDNSLCTGFCHWTAGPSPLSVRSGLFAVQYVLHLVRRIQPWHTSTQNHAQIIWKRDLNSVVSRFKNTKQRIFTVLVYFSWVTRLWLLLDNSLEHSTKFKHFHLMGSASKMEIRVLHRIHPFPGIFQKKKKVDYLRGGSYKHDNIHQFYKGWYEIFIYIFWSWSQRWISGANGLQNRKNRFRQGGLLQKVCSNMILAAKPSAQPLEKIM